MIERYFHQLKIILLGFDILSFILAFFIANQIKNVWIGDLRDEYLHAMLIGIIVVIFIFYHIGLYKLSGHFLHESFLVIKGTAIAFLILLALSFFYRSFTFSRLFFIYFSLFFLITTLMNRAIFRRLIKTLGSIKPIQRNTLIVGCGVIGKTLIDSLLARPSVWCLAGYLDDYDCTGTYEGIPCLGNLSQLEEVLSQRGITDVFIAIPSASRDLIKGLISKCESLNVNWRAVPDLYNLHVDNVHLDRLDTMPLVGAKATNIIGINQLIKRIFDLVLSSLMIISAAPLMPIIAIAIKLSSPGPVLFRQERVGLNGKHFNLLKFRTMYVNNDDKVHRAYATQWIKANAGHSKDTKGGTLFKIERDSRVTGVGYWLRKFSLDELPQLFNVWKGDMSLVGPRPPVPYEVEIYEDWQKKRLQAPPGLTGLWQVSGRNGISFEEMVQLDLSYINNWSLENDVKIILRTVATILSATGY
jgi:exopolysaccharide biosynthesis polyprenyl glycosylphosphotransferase